MIRVFEPRLTINDKISVLLALYKSEISGNSNSVKNFEKKLSEKFNRKFAIALTNGTVALEIAIKSLNLKKDDEVIVPSFTIISCLSAILRNNLVPVFVDVDKNTWNITLENIQKSLTKKTRAVLMVHTYGLPAEALEIEEFCKNNNLYLIEDAAEAHGQTYQDKPCGSFGDVSTFSFYVNKHITTGEGGAVLTDSKNKYEEIKQMINLDFNNNGSRFNHDNFYWNYRLSGLQASLGISQTKNLNNIIKQKQKQAEIYNKFFGDYSNLFKIPELHFRGSQNNYWVYGLAIENKSSREELMKYLFNNKIETREFFWPLHLQNALGGEYENLSLPISEFLGKNGFYIPIGPHITKKDQEFIAKKIINFFNQKLI